MRTTADEMSKPKTKKDFTELVHSVGDLTDNSPAVWFWTSVNDVS